MFDKWQKFGRLNSIKTLYIYIYFIKVNHLERIKQVEVDLDALQNENPLVTKTPCTHCRFLGYYIFATPTDLVLKVLMDTKFFNNFFIK